MKMNKMIASIALSAAAAATLAASAYDLTSYYVAYDSSDATQYALYMPSADLIYTHAAGQTTQADMNDVSSQFAAMPTFDNGELCFDALTGDGTSGASTMAGACYTVRFYYIQKEGTTFYLYDDEAMTLKMGTAGDGTSFTDVTSSYPDFVFDKATSTLYSDGMPSSESSSSTTSSTTSSTSTSTGASSSIYIPGVGSSTSSLPTVIISSSSSSSSSTGTTSSSTTTSSTATTSSTGSVSTDAPSQLTYTEATVSSEAVEVPNSAEYLLVNDSSYIKINADGTVCSVTDPDDASSQCLTTYAITTSDDGTNYTVTFPSTPTSVSYAE